MSAILAFVTASDREEALRIGRALVESRLAACINVLDGMQSVYRWQGRIEEAKECVLLVKSDASRAEALVARIREMHSYQTPCIEILPIAAGNPEYLAWIEKESRA